MSIYMLYKSDYLVEHQQALVCNRFCELRLKIKHYELKHNKTVKKMYL